LLLPHFATVKDHVFVSPFTLHFNGCRDRYNGCKNTNQQEKSIMASRSDNAVSTTPSATSTLEASSHSLQKKHQQETIPLPFTNAILRISYDGARFTGWSAANGKNDQSFQERRKRNRRRGGVEEFHEEKLPAGFVRSVEGVMKDNLAKLYGDVDPNTRIVVEGCSRTDKGVHATCMIAHIYCLKESFSMTASVPELKNKTEILEDSESEDCAGKNLSPVPGKRIPHPISPTDDSCFEVIPMNGNLSKIAFSFNRMRPPDVQITGIAPAPRMNNDAVFHASLSSKCKTYEYRISTGYFLDPTLRKSVWHVGSSDLNLEKIEKACALLKGRHDFSAFQGAARGSMEKRKRIKQQQNQDQNSSSGGNICTLYSINIDAENPINVHEDCYFPGVSPPVQNYNIVVKGDRFLYKMVRFLVGSLVAVGDGKLAVEDIERAIETGSWEIPGDPGGRRKQFECAPAHGLTLTHVDYGDDIAFDWQPLRDPTEGRRRK